MVFEKQLRMTPSTKTSYGQGQIYNLVQNDTDKIIAFTWQLVDFISLPIVLIYCSVSLFKLLGLSFFSGSIVFFVGAAVSSYISKKVKKLDIERKKKTDKRLNATTESLNNIKTLKFYQWSGIFKTEIQDRREQEMKVVTRQIHLLCITWALGTFFPSLMSTLSFYTNILLGNTIDLATAFTVLIFFDKIRGPMNALPWIINNTLEMLTSLTRIQNFLDMQELKIDNFLESNKDSEEQEFSIQVHKSHFTWGLAGVDEDSKDDDDKKAASAKKDAKEDIPKGRCCFGSKKADKKVEDEKEETVSIDQLVVLKDIDFKIKRGEFVCIIGDVGSGKSSLLSSIIGDLIPVSSTQADNLGIKSQGFNQYISKTEATKFSDDILSDISKNNKKVIELCGEIAYV